MISLERVRVSDSPFFAQFKEILGENKIVVIACEGKEIRVIDGSIGNDEKRNGFVNVEIDFPDGRERYRVYPFGVNRIISYRQILGCPARSQLGVELDSRSGLSFDRPKPRMNHSAIAGVIYEFVMQTMKSGTVKQFREAADFRRTLPVLNKSSLRKRRIL